MLIRRNVLTVLAIGSLHLFGATYSVTGAITATGVFSPDPLCGPDGIVTSPMHIGDGFQNEGWLWVTEGDTLTTNEASYISYSVAAKGSVYVTDSTWVADGSVFLSSQYYAVSTIGLDNATWEVNANMAMAQNDDGVVTVTAINGSYWYSWAAVHIATDDNTQVDITLDESTWDANGMVHISMDNWIYSDGYGTINIDTGGIMNCSNGLLVGDNGTINIDGGELVLHSETTWDGDLSISPNGADINVVIGPYLADYYLIELSDSLDFTNGIINITFEPDYVEDPAATYDLFDPLGSADLSLILATADEITTPPGWILDTSTGVLSYLQFQDCLQGPDVAVTALCENTHDYDSDGDVDLVDFAEFQLLFTD